MKQIGFGGQHDVYKKINGFVRKFPNEFNDSSFASAKTSLDIIERSFGGNFIPSTKVIPFNEQYIVIQKEISGNILRETPESGLNKEVLKQLHIFISRALDIIHKDYTRFDFIGILEGETSDKVRDKFNCIFPLKILRHYLRIRDIFQSSNIMVDLQGRMYFIDDVGSTKTFNKQAPMSQLALLYWKFIYWGYKKQIEKKLKKRDK